MYGNAVSGEGGGRHKITSKGRQRQDGELGDGGRGSECVGVCVCV